MQWLEPDSEVQLSIGSRFANIELVQLVLEELLEKLDFDEDRRYWIGIAVREAVANAIRHGNREDPAKQVDVGIGVQSGVLEISVRDQGDGFDLAELRSPIEPENLLRPDGRGIFYMKRFMDDIEYDFGVGGGTLVVLRKRIDSDGQQEAAR